MTEDEEAVKAKTQTLQSRVATATGTYTTKPRIPQVNPNGKETTTVNDDSEIAIPNLPKRFYGTVKLDALRLRRDVGQIADEVLQHLSSLVDAEVEITLEIQINVPDGVPENVVRTVKENCKVLKFTNHEFEQE
ncbi:MAG: hypothetical protein KME64_09420 [Scytonematopsis contorta HA4267-MV1]|jgi:hypothetical protein|nr:hypothetical protein [Scytonematopsis contorta HA4267-MV1]